MDGAPTPSGSVGAPPTRLSRGERATLATVVTLAMVFGTVAPFVVGALSPFIVPALSLSRSELGFFVTSSFAVATVAAVPSGRLIDRLQSRAVMVLLFAVSGATLLGIAAAPSYAALLVLALPVGIVQAACNPVTNRLVAEHIPDRQRGLVLGTKQAGVHIGGFLAGISLPFVAVTAGWRTAVAATAATALVPLWLSLRSVPPGGASGSLAASRSGDVVHAFRWTAGGVPYLMVYAFLMGGGVAAVTVYLPLYAHERLGMAEATAGSVLAAFAFTGVTARLAWGWLGDRTASVAAVLLALAAGATVATVVLWQAESRATWSVWVAAVGLGATAAAWNAVGMLAVVREVRHAHIGRATGLVTLGFFAGFIVSPTAFGALVDATDAYGAGWLAITGHFGVAALLTAWWWRREAGPSLGRPGARSVTSGVAHPDERA